MERHVHFYIVGKKPETAFIAIDRIPLDKIYVLNNDSEEFKKYEDEVVSGFKGVRKDVEVLDVNPFDYHDVYKKFQETADMEVSMNLDVFFHMNITMGPRPGTCALDSVAHSFDSDLYYIQEGIYTESGRDELKVIKIENFDIILELKKKPATLDLFLHFDKEESISNIKLAEYAGSSTKLPYHTKFLFDNGLIDRKGIRNAVWSLTEFGERVIKRL